MVSGRPIAIQCFGRQCARMGRWEFIDARGAPSAFLLRSHFRRPRQSKPLKFRPSPLGRGAKLLAFHVDMLLFEFAFDEYPEVLRAALCVSQLEATSRLDGIRAVQATSGEPEGKVNEMPKGIHKPVYRSSSPLLRCIDEFR